MESNEPEPLRRIDEPPDDEPPPRITVRITRISPIAGALAGGITVTLNGTGFQPGAEVYFGDSPSPEVIVVSGNTAQAKLPAAAQTGSVDVSLFNPDGSSATRPGGFTYVVTGTGAQAEVLGVAPLALIEDTESEVTLRGRNLVEAYTNGMLALRGPTRAQVAVSNHTSSRDEATGIEELTFTLRVTAAPPLEPLERLAIQVLASRRPGAAGDGVFESSRQMFTVLPRSRPVPLAYSANLDPGRPNVVVVAGRNLEGCTLDLGDGAAVHLQRSDDRFVAGIVTLPEGTAATASPQLSVRDAGGEEVAQYAMWIVPDASPAATAAAGDASASAAAEPAEGDINLMLTPVPGQQMLAPTEQDSTVFNLSSASSSSLFFDWFNFEITILDLTIVLPIVHEVHLIPFFDGVSADELSDSPVLAQVGRLLRLRGVGLLVALHVDVIIHIRVVLIIGFRFEIWGFGLFNEFPEFGWAIGSIVISIRIEIEIIFILAFLLAAVLPQGRLRVIFAFNLIAELDFTISTDGFRLRFGSDFHVNYRRIGPTLNNLLPCGGRFQLASENGQTVFPDAFGGHQSFYFPRAEGECCVPWDFDLQLVRSDPDGFQETVQTNFRADYCLNAAPSPALGQIIITSEHPEPTGFPPTLVMEVEQLALIRALSVPVDANGTPTGEPPQDVRDLGYDVEFFLGSPVEVVLDPGSLTQGNAFAIQPGDNVIHAKLTPRTTETPRLAFWPGGVLGFAIAGPLAEGREPGVVAGSLPVSVRGEIRVEAALAYEDAQDQLQITSEIERYEPFEAQREYVLAVKVTVPERGPLPQSLTIKVERAEFARPPLAGAGTPFTRERHLVNDPERFFTGNLAVKNQQGTLQLSRDMRGDKWIKVPGLTIQPNQQERVAANGTLHLVPPGRKVTNQDVTLSVGLRVEARGAKVSLVGRPLNWTVVNDETFEEYLRGFGEVQAILSGSDATLTKFRDFAKTFYGELSISRPPAAPTPEFLRGKGEELWNHAYQAVQATPPAQPLIDDRPLYWARLQSIAALRAFYRRNKLTPSPTTDQFETTVRQFEWPSRGLDQSDGRIVFPAEAAGFRRAIITGFDPFELPDSPNTSNPSGLIALEFNAKRVGPTQSSVYVRTAIFPVRYKEFDEGLIERAVKPSLSSIVMLMTTSQNGSANYYDVERFAGRNRVISTDNENKRPRPLPVSAREYVESTLPYERVITSPETLEGPMGPAPFVIDQSYVVAGDPGRRSVNRKPNPDPPASREMARPGDFRPEPLLDDVDKAAYTKFPNERPDPTQTSDEGSGGSYLSNEIFYRTALLRDTERPPLPGETQSPLAAGHFHIPATGRQPRVVGEALIRGVRTAVERFLASLFRTRAAQDITFPQTNVNTASAPITLSVTNITNETINAVTVDVPPPFWVNWPGPTPIPLSPGSTLPLPFTFSPTTPGVHTANVRLLDRNGEVLLTTTLTGEALPTYTITGQVMTGGIPLQGVQVTLSGSRTASVLTGKGGRYSFTNLDAGGNYTITPSKANYTFTPPSQAFSGLAANQTADFAATLNRHRIRGRVRTASGVPIPNATVTLFGPVTDTRTTDATGEYLFADLPAGGDYVVTVNRTNYDFTVVTQVFKQLAADAEFDFTGALVSYRISGRVTDGVAGLGGVTVNLSGSQSTTATTDASGNYSFIVPAEGNYTVTPSRTHYTFTPPSLSFNNLEGDRTADFVATLNRYSISGRVTREDGSALAGATLALGGTRMATTVSDANGAYSFAELPAGGSYTVTVSRANYSFAQPSRTFNDLASTQTAEFTGALVNYTVGGRVTSGTSGLSGVTVMLSGSQSATATTDASGNYSFTVKAEGNYTVTPSKQHYTFSPASATFNNLSGNQTTNFTATLNTHTISGRVTNAAGVPLAGVAITLSGSQPGTATSDPSGNYSFANLSAGGSYTVMLSSANYIFTPTSQSFSNLGANQMANFAGALVRYTVSGKVTLDGAGLGGVTVTLSGSEAGTATTDAAGNYSFTVTAEGSYTVTASKTNYTFAPPSATFSNLGANQSADFSATLNRHRISGRVATANGTGIAGVVVMLSGSRSTTTSTDASGNYSFANLPAGGTYTVTPSRSNYSFTPASRTFDNLVADAAFDFTGALVSYRIGGRITDGSDGLGGVTVMLSGSQSSSATTDASGNYSFTVTAEGNYTVAPSKQHYTFTPPPITFNHLGGNQTADFSATLNRHTISGRVTTAGGGALPNITLRLSGSQSTTATTDASGNYSFANLPAGGSYTVTAARANYAFTPASKSFSDLGANRTADFTGGLVSYRISGRVISGDAGLAGVTINLSGSQSATATTDASGNYSFTVPAEGSYTVTASKTHYTFAPPSHSFNNLGGDQAADFAATLNRHTISGRVTSRGAGLGGFSVHLSGSQTGTVLTDANGDYSFTDLPAGGDYTITPSRDNYTFTPASHSFGDLGASQTADFTGTLVSYIVSGRVTRGGSGLAGVTINLGGSQDDAAVTGVSGDYSFTVTAEGSYTVTPSEPHYTFTPPGASFSNLGADQRADFGATLNHHTISGRITRADGTGIAGVAVTLSGAQTGAKTTDAAGNYSFTGLPAGGSYTVTAARTNYTFTPAISFSDLIANQTADFTGTPVSYTISGRVTSGGVGLADITVRLTGSETAATTDAAGNYSFTVPAEGSYTVSPSEHYAFTPPSATFDSLAANQTADFGAPPNRHRINGRLTNPTGDALPNVLLSLTGSQSRTTRADEAGNYSFANLPEGGNYTVTPKLFGYSFTPLSRTLNGLSADQARDFAAGPVGGVRINLALPSDGPVFSVSTMYRLGRAPSAVINGDLRGIDWHDATLDGSPAWLEVSFAGLKTISEVHVFNIQENLAAIAELAEATTFTQHGLQDFGVEYWTGAGWQPVPGGAVTNNNRVWVKVAFPPLTTTKIRLVVRRALGG